MYFDVCGIENEKVLSGILQASRALFSPASCCALRIGWRLVGPSKEPSHNRIVVRRSVGVVDWSTCCIRTTTWRCVGWKRRILLRRTIDWLLRIIGLSKASLWLLISGLWRGIGRTGRLRDSVLWHCGCSITLRSITL